MTQKSIQIGDATQQQIDDLRRWGWGNFSDIVRMAIDRMWREEEERREAAAGSNRESWPAGKGENPAGQRVNQRPPQPLE